MRRHGTARCTPQCACILLQITLVVGQAAAKSEDPPTDLQEALQELLLWLLAAAQLSGRTELPLQVGDKLPVRPALCCVEVLRLDTVC